MDSDKRLENSTIQGIPENCCAKVLLTLCFDFPERLENSVLLPTLEVLLPLPSALFSTH